MTLSQKVETLLKETLPEAAFLQVKERKYFTGRPYLMIFFAASELDLNNVSMQKPQAVSLSLDLETLELQTQVFGGMGGNRIYLIPDKENPKEQHLAMAGYKIAFRTPKPEEKNVLAAIKRFAENWIMAMETNRSRLMYQDMVDYNALLR